ncbi:MAG: NAD(P)-dependent alcohol dehydrogenase [Alphaproteobacteria bacterium]|nr:NAD(P)-dependent alcohol dehydrogenase [Alphaproteobacteria bacterium]
MKQWRVSGGAGLDHLQLVEVPVPEPGPREVLVRLGAAALNYRDLLTIKGGYGSRQLKELVPLSDGAGTVEALGPGVTRFGVGDRVTANFFQSWIGGPPSEARLAGNLGGMLEGTLTEYRVFHEDGLVATPPHLSDAEAASLTCAGLTAWSAVVTQGRVQPGETVLVQGTGGVSLFALQFARMAGARIIATSSSEEKLARLRQLGADETINYRTTPDWGKVARGMAGGLGVDHVVEVGGAGTLNQSIRAVRVGGTISMIGVLAGPAEGDLAIPLVVMQNIRLQGVTVGSRDQMEAMCRAIARLGVRPVIDRIFPFAEAKDAFAHMAAGRHFGKVAIALRDD